MEQRKCLASRPRRSSKFSPSNAEHESPNEQNIEGHIERTVSSVLVNIKHIVYFYQRWYDVLFIVNCDENFAKVWSNRRDVNTMELTRYISKKRSEIPGDVLILSTTNKCTHLQFETICEESKISNVYVLQQFDEEHCILILSKGEKLEYADATKTFIKETEIFKTFNNPLHVFCTPSGMGKTTLLQVLRDKHCPTDCKVVYIALREYNKRVYEPPDFGNLFEHLNERSGPKPYLFLDGLDELKGDLIDDIFKFVKLVSSRGINIWLASRESLRELICEKLYAVPIEIVELNKEEQEYYIKRKLEKRYANEEIDKIKSAVSTSIKLNDSQDLLGNPLQLHILTEIFLEDECKETFEVVKNNHLFLLTQIYNVLLKGKIKHAQEKYLRKDQARLLKPLDDILQDYELPALQACFSKGDCNKLSLNFDAREVKIFINKLKKDDDEIGIICRIDKNDKAIFTYQAYAEYFAARWFKRHPGRISLLRDEIFSGKYQHLRMIFDVMLAENSPLHLAVIYKDIEQVEEHIQDIDFKDDGGRTALHLVCSYEQKYPLLDDPEKYAKQLENEKQESPSYSGIIRKLLEKGRKILKQKDKIFNFDCASYALQSQCWPAIDWMLEMKTIAFKKLQRIIMKHYDYNMKCLAFYAAQFGCNSLLQNLIKHYPGLRKQLKTSEMIGLPILEYACKEKRFDLLEILINNKVKCGRGNTILHFLVESCPEIYREEILIAIKKFNIDVNARNDDGATALHKAAESADVKIVEMLMENGADFRILDNEGRSPWDYALSRSRRDIIKSVLGRNQLSVNERNSDGTKHFAFKEGEDNAKNLANSIGVIKLFLDKGVYPNARNNKDEFKTADFLLENGSESLIDAKFENGKTVLHLACCEHRREDVIQLLERGADPNIVDNDNRNALHHYFLKFYAEDVVHAMINHGIDLNTKYKEGNTLLHIVCTQGDTRTMTKLIERKVDLNMTNDENRNALHSLFQTLQHTEVRVKDRLINRHKYGIDIQHEHDPNTLHFGCEGCYHSLIILKPLREDEEYKQKLCTILGDRDLTEIFLKYTRSGIFASESIFLTARIIIFKMIQCLVEHGLDITQEDKYKRTVLDYASKLKKEYPEIMKFLRTAHLHCEQNFSHAKENEDVTTLAEAAESVKISGIESDNVQILNILSKLFPNMQNTIRRKAVNEQNKNRTTSFHFATRKAKLAKERKNIQGQLNFLVMLHMNQ